MSAVVRVIGDALPGGGDEKYVSVTTASNGRLYAPPYRASQVLEIDPAAGTTRLIGDELQGRLKYTSLAAASNGRLYAAPNDASQVLEINLSVIRVSWTVLLRQMEALLSDDQGGVLVEVLAAQPGLWILVHSEPGLQYRVLAFV